MIPVRLSWLLLLHYCEEAWERSQILALLITNFSVLTFWKICALLWAGIMWFSMGNDEWLNLQSWVAHLKTLIIVQAEHYFLSVHWEQSSWSVTGDCDSLFALKPEWPTSCWHLRLSHLSSMASGVWLWFLTYLGYVIPLLLITRHKSKE